MRNTPQILMTNTSLRRGSSQASLASTPAYRPPWLSSGAPASLPRSLRRTTRLLHPMNSPCSKCRLWMLSLMSGATTCPST